MRNLLRIAAPLLLGFSAAPALASSDTQYWQTLSVEGMVNDRLVLSNETVLRMGGPRGFYEIEDNIMLGYKVNPHLTLSLGYTHDPNYFQGSFTVMEHRLRQQVSIGKLRLGRATLSARLRLEERWREGQSGTGWRLRPQVKLAVPLTGHTMLIVSHESFVDLNTVGFQTKPGSERMRNAIAISQPLSKHLNIEFGYMEQHGFVANAPDTNNHVATMSLSLSL